jgi:hypothetical protein
MSGMDNVGIVLQNYSHSTDPQTGEILKNVKQQAEKYSFNVI